MLFGTYKFDGPIRALRNKRAQLKQDPTSPIHWLAKFQKTIVPQDYESWTKLPKHHFADINEDF